MLQVRQYELETGGIVLVPSFISVHDISINIVSDNKLLESSLKRHLEREFDIVDNITELISTPYKQVYACFKWIDKESGQTDQGQIRAFEIVSSEQ